MITRQEYMAGPHMGEEGTRNHRTYYVQFVTPYLQAAVVDRFGSAKLRTAYAEDPYLNTIPLHYWDELEYTARMCAKHLLTACGDFWSQAGAVCILKEAARLAVETQTDVH